MNVYLLNGQEDIFNVQIIQPILSRNHTETNEMFMYSLYINWTTLEEIRTKLRSIQCLFIYDSTDSTASGSPTECRTNFVNITFAEGNN